MKHLTYLFLLLSSFCFAQKISINRPEIVIPILERFISEAQVRGIDGRKLLSELDSINVIERPMYEGKECNGILWERGDKKWMEIRESLFYSDDNASFRTMFHEIGHIVDLEDCKKCTYNFMSHQTSLRANYLFKDDQLSLVYLDLYFEAIRNPKKYNDGHTHY